MKKTALLIIALAAAIGQCFAAKTLSAADVLAACAAKIAESPSFNVELILQSGQQKQPVTLTVAGPMFTLDCADMAIWYDGSTQWTASKRSREVSITEPLAEELAQANPFAILNHPEAAFDIRKLPADKPGTERVELVPKAKGTGLRHAAVTIDTATSLPRLITLQLSNGQRVTALVSKATPGKKLAPAQFRWDKAKFPAATINDLR